MADNDEPERHINIHFSPEIMAGHYANFANVSFSDYEFTITFARVDHEIDADEIPGVVVSRVNLSPKFMRELADALEDSWSKWATREGIKNLPEFGGGSSAADAARPLLSSARVARRVAPRAPLSASSIAKATPLADAAIQPHCGMSRPDEQRGDEARRAAPSESPRQSFGSAITADGLPCVALVRDAEPDPLDRRRVGRRAGT